jgi:asparagine synthase (glutamine-hydrolysing)
MCGILGVAMVPGASPPARLPSSIRLDALRDRGPDNVGAMDLPEVALRHTRLAVIDAAETSNQPLRSGDLTLVCNGEIWNHRALRAAAGDYVYRTTSDCEAILHVYAEEGLAGLARLDGFYSFILYDARARKLIAHRDPIGKKPLFHASRGGLHWFASNATAIRENAAGAFPARPSQVAFFLAHGFTHPEQGFFEGIEPLRPGEAVEIDLETGAVTRSALRARAIDYSGFDFRPDTVVTEFDRLLRLAVERRVTGLQTPVLVFSGGIDSTLLAAELLEAAPQTRLISLRQPVPLINDEVYARYAALRLGGKLSFATPWRDLGTLVSASIARLDQPLAVESYFILSALAAAARAHGNVLFTGDGADEVCLGYRRPSQWFTSGAPDPRPTLTGPAPLGTYSDWGRVQGQVDLVGHGFVKVDKATAENRMEARCPYLDAELVAFFRQIPPSFWRDALDVPKQPLRASLRARGFPGWFIERRKMGFSLPLRYLLAPHFRDFREALVRLTPLLEAVGVPRQVPSSALAFFTDFAPNWRRYVLGTFLARQGL